MAEKLCETFMINVNLNDQSQDWNTNGFIIIRHC